MSAASLRRSGRRASRKNSDYNVGDVVEVSVFVSFNLLLLSDIPPIGQLHRGPR
jgi:hypothetical protein